MMPSTTIENPDVLVSNNSIKEFMLGIALNKSQSSTSNTNVKNSTTCRSEHLRDKKLRRTLSKDSVLNNSNDESDCFWQKQQEIWCKDLNEKIQRQFSISNSATDLVIQLPYGLVTRLSREILAASLQEPCGIRGSSVQLRLLHEDVASVLMSCPGKSYETNHNSRCVSWSEVPSNLFPEPTTSRKNSCQDKSNSILDFQCLPEMDAKLTRKYSPDSCSTDSGFYETTPQKRKLRASLSDSDSTCVPILPKLSSASAINVPCADLGHIEFDPNTVPNFEIYVYLAPVTSWSWKVRRLFAPSFSCNDLMRPKRQKRRGVVTVVSDFTLVKRKLYRSRCNSIEVIRCPPTQNGF